MTAPPRIRSTDRTRILARTAVDHPDQDAAAGTEQKFALSATQVMASMAAAVTAALVGSRLGVAGTVIGAGLASVISVVGGAVIGHSILLTRKQVRRAVLQVRGVGPDSSAGGVAATGDQYAATTVLPAARSARNPADDYTVVIPAITRTDLQQAGPGAGPGRPRPTGRRVPTGVLLGVAASLAIFVSALGAVTVFETIKGSPLSGGESGGLSVLGGNGGDPVGTPVTTVSVATEPSTVTQTVTSEVTAAPTTAQPTPSQSTTATSSAAATSSPPASASPVEAPAAAAIPVSPTGTVPATWNPK